MRQGIAFLPMAVESFGGWWHEVAEREVRKPGGRLGLSHWPRGAGARHPAGQG